MEAGLVLTPKPIRLGEPGYWDHLNGFYLRLSSDGEDEEDVHHDDPQTRLKQGSPKEKGRLIDRLALFPNLAPTLPTYTDSLYTLHASSRTRLPCECFSTFASGSIASFKSLEIRGEQSLMRSEFEQDDRLSTTNLIDWQTKECWMSGVIRDQVYGGVGTDAIRLYRASDFRTSSSTINESLKLERECESPAEEELWTSSSSINITSPNSYLSPPNATYSSEDSSSDFFISRRSSGSPPCFRSERSPSKSPNGLCKLRPNSMKKLRKNDAKSYKCDYVNCCKQFLRKEELTRHKKTHCSDRPFQCEICKRKFNRKDHMTKHQATHQDVSMRRRYCCPSPGCDRCYTRSDALSRHRSAAHPTQHPIIPYTCANAHFQVS